jgi:hypothetical protein
MRKVMQIQKGRGKDARVYTIAAFEQGVTDKGEENENTEGLTEYSVRLQVYVGTRGKIIQFLLTLNDEEKQQQNETVLRQ